MKSQCYADYDPSFTAVKTQGRCDGSFLPEKRVGTRLYAKPAIGFQMYCHQCCWQEGNFYNVRLTQAIVDLNVRGNSYGTPSENEIAEPISLCPYFLGCALDDFDNPHFEVVTHFLEISKAGEEYKHCRAENQNENENDNRIAADSANSQTETCKAEYSRSSPKPRTDHGSSFADLVLGQESLLHGPILARIHRAAKSGAASLTEPGLSTTCALQPPRSNLPTPYAPNF